MVEAQRPIRARRPRPDGRSHGDRRALHRGFEQRPSQSALRVCLSVPDPGLVVMGGVPRAGAPTRPDERPHPRCSGGRHGHGGAATLGAADAHARAETAHGHRRRSRRVARMALAATPSLGFGGAALRGARPRVSLECPTRPSSRGEPPARSSSLRVERTSCWPRRSRQVPPRCSQVPCRPTGSTSTPSSTPCTTVLRHRARSHGSSSTTSRSGRSVLVSPSSPAC